MNVNNNIVKTFLFCFRYIKYTKLCNKNKVLSNTRIQFYLEKSSEKKIYLYEDYSLFFVYF